MTEKVLTEDIAEQFLADWLDLSEFTAIEDHAAEMLSTYEDVSPVDPEYPDHDNFFLTDDQIKLVDRLKELTNNENCFQVFTYESSIPYLIRKQSCSKFYHIFNLGSKKHQYDFIEEIKFTKPKYILFEGTYDGWGVIPKERFPYIYEYIKKNYTVGETFISWKILYLKK